MATTFEVRNYCFNVLTYRETAPEWANPIVDANNKYYTKIIIPDDVEIQKLKGIYNFFTLYQAKTYEPDYYSDVCYCFYHKSNGKLFGYAIPRYEKIEAISFFYRKG